MNFVIQFVMKSVGVFRFVFPSLHLYIFNGNLCLLCGSIHSPPSVNFLPLAGEKGKKLFMPCMNENYTTMKLLT